MSDQIEPEKGFFEKLGEILNAPLPGTVEAEGKQAPASTEKQGKQAADQEEDGPILERIKEILNTPLPATPTEPSAEVAGDKPVVASDVEALEDQWWERDWDAFRQHQERERQGLNLKQRRDQEAFARYQEQEKMQFDGHQTREFEGFKQQAQWKMNVWGQQIEAMKSGQQAPPQPWGMAPPAPLPGAPLPPWMRKPSN